MTGKPFAPSARITLGETPRALWFCFFPIASVVLVIAALAGSAQGRDLLAALKWSSGRHHGDFGSFQLVSFWAMAAVCVVAVAYGSCLAIQSFCLIRTPMPGDSERRKVGKAVAVALTTLAAASIVLAFCAAHGVALTRSPVWLLRTVTALLTLETICRLLRAKNAVDGRATWARYFAVALGVFLVEWSPEWLTGDLSVSLHPFWDALIPLAGCLLWLLCLKGLHLTAWKWRGILCVAALGVPLALMCWDPSGWAVVVIWVSGLFARRLVPWLLREVQGPPHLMLGAVICFSLCIAGVVLSVNDLSTSLGALAIILASCGSWAVVGTLVFVVLPTHFQLPILTPVALLLPIVLSPLNNNHQIRLLDTPEQTFLRPNAGQDFLEWYDRNSEGDPDFPVFLVAAAGGGLRAAYWTATILATFDDQTCGEFRRHVYALSGVSGGSLGAATYVAAASLPSRAKKQPDCRRASWGARPPVLVNRVQRFLSHDFLSPLVSSLLFSDVPQSYFPLPILPDRASALEHAWEKRWLSSMGNDAFAQPISALFTQIRTERLPSLIFNSTRVEDGRRVVLSNLKMGVTDGYDLLNEVPNLDAMPLSTAIHTSARFTFVSPAGAVPLNGKPGEKAMWGHLVDGGYFENSGAAALMDLVDEIHLAWRRDNRQGNPKIIALLVSNDPSDVENMCGNDFQPHIQAGEDRNEAEPAWLPELMSPMETLLQTRNARAPLHERELATRIADAFGQDVCHSVVEERLGVLGGRSLEKRQPPLGWYLGELSKGVMKSAASVALKRAPFTDDGFACRKPQGSFFEGSGNCSAQGKWAGVVGQIYLRRATSLLPLLRDGHHVLVTFMPSDPRAPAEWGHTLRAAGVPIESVLTSPEAQSRRAVAAAGFKNDVKSVGVLGIQGRESVQSVIAAALDSGKNTLVVTHRERLAASYAQLSNLAVGEVAVFEKDENGTPVLVGRIKGPQWKTVVRLVDGP